ncbi:hypothetical protein IC582_027157 [Cucumis melo]
METLSFCPPVAYFAHFGPPCLPHQATMIQGDSNQTEANHYRISEPVGEISNSPSNSSHGVPSHALDFQFQKALSLFLSPHSRVESTQLGAGYFLIEMEPMIPSFDCPVSPPQSSHNSLPSGSAHTNY